MLLVSLLVSFTSCYLPKADIWVAFGVGKNYRLYSINALSTSLGTKRSQELPMLHARFLDATQPLLFGEQEEVVLASLDGV